MKKHLYNNLHIYILFISIISIYTFKITLLSIILSIISLISSLIFSKKHIKILLITIIISLISIILNILVIINNQQKEIDIYKDTNILIGTWIYNENGGKYIFNEDYTYIQYTSKDTTNNYCKGTYKYSYGITNDTGISLRQDENYYYYDLTIIEQECLIMNKKTTDTYTKKMHLGINKYQNKDTLILSNVENKNIFTMTKEKKE